MLRFNLLEKIFKEIVVLGIELTAYMCPMIVKKMN